MLNEQCDIIIVNWNLVKFLKPCIESIYKNTDYPFHLIIVDNGSTEPETVKYLDHLETEKKDLTIIRNSKNEGFPRGANIGIRHSQASYVCLLNNDTLVAPGWLEKLVFTLERYPKVGVVIAEGGTFDLQNSPWVKGSALEEGVTRYAQTLENAQIDDLEEVSLCSLFCSVFKRETFNKLGLLDEIFSPCNFEDADFQMRLMEAGYMSVLNKKAYVYHHVSKTVLKLSEKERQHQKNKKIFYERWGDKIDTLRFFCPILRTESLDSAIEDIYKILRRDNQMWLLLPDNINVKSILKKRSLLPHIGLHIQGVPLFLFYFYCTIQFLIKKKPFDAVYVPEKSTKTFFNTINIFLKKIIISAPEDLLTLKKRTNVS